MDSLGVPPEAFGSAPNIEKAPGAVAFDLAIGEIEFLINPGPNRAADRARGMVNLTPPGLVVILARGPVDDVEPRIDFQFLGKDEGLRRKILVNQHWSRPGILFHKRDIFDRKSRIMDASQVTSPAVLVPFIIEDHRTCWILTVTK